MRFKDNDTRTRTAFLNSSFFPVDKVRSTEGKYEIINGNTGKTISTVSDRYTLLENKRLIEPFIDHFGINALTEYHRSGRNFAYTFDTGREFEVAHNDSIKERLIIQNSYDKSRAYSFMFGAFRFVCSNGLYTGQAVIAYKKIHIGDIPVDEMINTVVSKYKDNSFDLWRNLATHPLTQEEELELARNFEAFVAEEKDAHETLRGTYHEPLDNRYFNRQIRERASYLIEKPESVDNARTAWGLLNQINRAMPQIKGLRGNSGIHKRILGNVNAERYISDRLGITKDSSPLVQDSFESKFMEIINA